MGCEVRQKASRVTAERVTLDEFNSIPSGPLPMALDPEADEIQARLRKVDGASFAFEQPEAIDSLWGNDGEAIWAPGEALLLVGPDGVGKTTLLQQLWLARAGLRDEVLSLPVEPAEGMGIYLAMDRPAQAARSFRRMVDQEQAETLRQRLAVWKGPLPINVLEHPWTFADWVASEFPLASDVFVDSLKDLAPKLSEDETGSKLNMARQELLARGLQVVENHHQRKEQRGQGAPKTLADVYGSRWLTAGAGSVLLLWGEPGDLVVDAIHLKQPLEPFGPHRVIHDHSCGHSSLYEPSDLLETLERTPNGMRVADAARSLFETSATTTPNQIEKARRKLNKLCEKGHAERRDDPGGTARYFARSAP
jgi:replicative DNA helicase